ncbi:MAG TPA: ISNCY family transposase [Patescibacteria group bacterium]|nr:ISNCY family transposase [Patescibacteria group bacterium]
MTQKLIAMTEKELTRHSIIKDLINKKINGTDASKLLGVTVRQIKRMKAVVLKYGAKGLAHKSRGQKSNRILDPDILEKVKKLLEEKYYDFGPTFATEKLDEIDQIIIGKETIRSIMIELKLWQVKPRKESKAKWHIWRARKDNYGEMQQFDGSYHVWFGDEEYCLLLSVDDATGKITHAKFDINESTVAVFKFWLEYFALHGLPISIYLDKFSTYKINHKNAVDNKDMITQFQRAMNQVGIKPITAHSPEAKGRVERMNETLQDRLVKELRLAGINTVEEANKFLEEYIPKFNAKFAVVPKRRKDLHKTLNKNTKEKLPQTFSIQKERIVNNDYTIRFESNYYQLDRIQTTTVYKKDRIMVETHLGGEIKLRLREFYLNYKLLPDKPKKEIEVKLVALTKQMQGSYKPPAGHPWREQFLFGKRGIRQEIQAPK